MSRIDLDELERKARAASTQDEWQWRADESDVLEGKHDGQVVLFLADLQIIATISDREHIAAASPRVVAALIARIRELEGTIRSFARAELLGTQVAAALWAVVEKGAALP